LLKDTAEKVRRGGGQAEITFRDTTDNDEFVGMIYDQDIRWAQEIEKVVDVAYTAGQEGRFEEALKYYRKALQMAPGGDLFLMSIGVCYIQLGDKARGIRFLERAAEISPKNGRIRKNLQAARGW
jgi:Flp pilus assembly protein TadD